MKIRDIIKNSMDQISGISSTPMLDSELMAAKALGKDLAINKSKTIVMGAAGILRQVHKIIKFKV